MYSIPTFCVMSYLLWWLSSRYQKGSYDWFLVLIVSFLVKKWGDKPKKALFWLFVWNKICRYQNRNVIFNRCAVNCAIKNLPIRTLKQRTWGHEKSIGTKFLYGYKEKVFSYSKSQIRMQTHGIESYIHIKDEVLIKLHT